MSEFVRRGVALDFHCSERWRAPIEATALEGQKVVYVSLGTDFHGNLELYRRGLRALGGSHALVLSVSGSGSELTLEHVARRRPAAVHATRTGPIEQAAANLPV